MTTADTPADVPGKDAPDRPPLADFLGRPLAPLAARWKAGDERRTGMRTEDARKAVMDANKAHREAMRDLRRDQKAFEHARGEVGWWNVFNGERRAAAAVVRDSRELARDARRACREAKRQYPLALPSFAARCHAAHIVPTFLWDVVSDSAAASAAPWMSVAAVLLNVAAVKLGMRHVDTAVAADDAAVSLDPLQPSQAEAELLQRLTPEAWQGAAEQRGLSDVVSLGGTLTESGIQAKLVLNGTMDVPTLQRREPQLRAALRLREGVRLELREGKTGGQARLTLRTRSAADGLDMTGWTPGAPWAVNTVTGEAVPVPLGKRLLVAGTSGSGKSWSMRPLMAEASEYDDHRLVIFDRKYVEGRTWEHRARIVTELDEMADLCDELTEEGESRLKLIPRGKDVVEISPSRPRITVLVDEGGELISDCTKEYERIIETLRTIARKYRAAEIILVWATQKPSMSGKGYGIDSQIAGQMTDRLSLAVTTATEARVVFGDDAAEAGWMSNKLPMPGYALLRQQELGPACVPQTLRMRAMSPQQVIDLPSRPVWSRVVSSTGATRADLATRAAIEAAGDPWEAVTVELPAASQKKPPVSADDRDDQIMAELDRDPCRSMSSIAAAIDASKSVVKRRLEALETAGLVVRDDDGCWHAKPDKLSS